MTIQPRGDGAGGGKAFTAKEAYFVADARNHPALAAPLVEATSARRAVFEPMLRDGDVCGVLIVIWQRPLETLPEASGGVLRLVAAQAAIAIEHAAPAGARGGAGADRLADRPGDAARVRGGAAARDRARPPLATRRCRSPGSTSTT